MIRRSAREHREIAQDALNQLAAALKAVGIVLPSLSLDWASPYTGIVLVELGAAHPDEIARLTAIIRLAAAHAQP